MKTRYFSLRNFMPNFFKKASNWTHGLTVILLLVQLPFSTLYSQEVLNGQKSKCKLQIKLDDSVSSCEESVTLNPVVKDNNSCEECTGYDIKNTTYVRDTNVKYAVWFAVEGSKNDNQFLKNIDLSWTEIGTDTIRISGKVEDRDTKEKYKLDVVLSKKSLSPPEGSPKEHKEYNENIEGWVYYREMEGTLVRLSDDWKLRISRRGPAFQLGDGANEAENTKAKYGGSGWFSDSDKNIIGDININIGDCNNESTNDDVSYLWSNGATTPTITVKESGEYTVTVKDCKSCEKSAKISVDLIEVSVSAGEDQTITEGQSVILTSVEGAESVLWYVGDELVYTSENGEGISVSPTETTTYKVVAIINGCEAEDEVTITVEACDITVDLGDDLEVCVNDTTTLEANTSGINPENCSIDQIAYTWSTGETTATIDVADPGEYSVEITACSCTAADSITVSINEVNVSAGEDQTITEGQSVTLTSVEGAESVLWYVGDELVYTSENGEGTSVSPTETTTYKVVAIIDGCEAEDEITITVEACDIAVDLGDDLVICNGELTNLTAFTSGADFGGCTSFNLESTNYCSGINTYLVSLGEQNNRVYLVNESVVWSEVNDTTSQMEGIAVNSQDASDKYEILVTLVDKTTTPPAGSPRDHFCAEVDTNDWVYYPSFSGTITSMNNGSVINVSRRGPSFQVGSGANDTELLANKIGGSGWFITDDQSFGIGDFNFTLGACMNVNENLTYLWSTGATSPSIQVNTPGEYTVTVTNSDNCSVSDSIILSESNPSISAGEDQTIVPGGSAKLDAIPGATLRQWSVDGNVFFSTASPSSSPEVSPTETTTYTVLARFGSCIVEDSVTITVEQCEPFEIDAGEDAMVVEGESIELQPVPNADLVEWLVFDEVVYSTEIDGEAPTVSPLETTTYTVRATTNGCIAEDTVEITVIDCDNLTVTRCVDVTITEGESATLTKILGVDYTEWSLNGEVFFTTVSPSSAPEVSPTVTTTYNVKSTRGNCEFFDSLTVTVESCEELSLDAGEDITIAEGAKVKLNAIPNFDYKEWSVDGKVFFTTVSPSAAPEVSPMETTTYIVTGEVGSCVVESSVTITVIPCSEIDVSAGEDVTIDELDSVKLSPIAGVDENEWSVDGEIFFTTVSPSSSPTVSPTETTTYTVISRVGGCIFENMVTVFVNPVCNVFSINAGSDQTIDLGDSVTLDPIMAQADNITWSVEGEVIFSTISPSASPTVSPTETTSYVVNASFGNCVVNDTVTIIIAKDCEDLTINGGSDTSVAEGSSVELNAIANADFVEWSANGEIFFTTTSPSTAPVVMPSTTTTYTVKATIGDCIVEDTFTISVFPCNSYSVNAGSDMTISQGESTRLAPISDADLREWYANGELIYSTISPTSSPSVSPLVTTTYTVVVTFGSCSYEDEVIVTVIPCEDTEVDAGQDVSIDFGDSVQLPPIANADYREWEANGEVIFGTISPSSSPTVSPNATTTYTVNITIGLCTYSDTITVSVSEPCALQVQIGSNVSNDLGYDITACPGDVIILDPKACSCPINSYTDSNELVITNYDYLWSTGETSRRIEVIVDQETTYAVTVIDENGCEVSNEITIIPDVSGNCTDGPIDDVVIFPTVISNQSNITLSMASFKEQRVSVELLTLNGDVENVESYMIKEGTNEVPVTSSNGNISTLASGMYILQIKGENFIEIKRFVKM